jgi:hypothetical protein
LHWFCEIIGVWWLVCWKSLCLSLYPTYRLLEPNDAVGIDNNYHLQEMSKECEIAICAWGNSPILSKIKPKHKPLKYVSIPLNYIELSKDGTPKHPLYLKSELKSVNQTFSKRHLINTMLL